MVEPVVAAAAIARAIVGIGIIIYFFRLADMFRGGLLYKGFRLVVVAFLLSTIAELALVLAAFGEPPGFLVIQSAASAFAFMLLSLGVALSYQGWWRMAQKPQEAPASPANAPSIGAETFNAALLKHLEEKVAQTVGSGGASTFFTYLDSNFGVSKGDIPDNIGAVSRSLHDLFGATAASGVERTVISAVISELQLPPPKTPGDAARTPSFIEAVEQLRVEIRKGGKA